MDASQNDGFGSFTNGGMIGGALPNAPIHADGDVVLPGDYAEQKSGKKRIALVVGLICGVVALAVLLIVMTISQGNGGIEEKYNKYMNYLVSGVDSSEKVSLYEIGQSYVETARYRLGDDGESDYYGQLALLWNKFYDSANNSLKEKNEILSVNDDIQFLRVYYNGHELFDNEESEESLEVSVSEMMSLIDKLQNLGSKTADGYIDYLEMYIDILTRFSSLEAFVTDSVAVEMARSVSDNMMEYVYRVISRLVKQSFEVGEILGGNNE